MSLNASSNPDYSRPIELIDGVYWVGFHDVPSGSQANPYLIVDGDEAVVIDGGSRSAFPRVMIKILQTGISPSSILALVYQNYDPRLCGSIPHLEAIINRADLKIISDESNHRFIQHYSETATLLSLGNIRHELRFSSGRRLQFIKTPYAHSVGSFTTFDEKTGILFTSDLFSGYFSRWNLFLRLSTACMDCRSPDPSSSCKVNDGACPVWEIMEFHRHIMTSERALRLALEQIARIPFSVIAPQHGSVIHKPEDIVLICQHLASLKGVGIDHILGDRPFFELGNIEPLLERFGKGTPMNEQMLSELKNGHLANPQVSKLMTLLMEQWAKEKDHEIKQQLLRSTVLRYADAEGKLAEMNRTKNRFIGLVAHDLRNPLVSIRGLSEILLHDRADPLSEQQRDFLNTIFSASNSMLTLVNDILDMAVIESGNLKLQVRKDSLGRLIRGRVKVNGILAKQKRVYLDQHISRIPNFPFDRNRISQVLDNLIGNAIKFSCEKTRISVTLSRRNGTAAVSVRDQGMGITPEDQARIFSGHPGFRNKPTGGEKSTGMGLTIVRKIVEEHKGALSVESEVGLGSTFTFTLPLEV